MVRARERPGIERAGGLRLMSASLRQEWPAMDDRARRSAGASRRAFLLKSAAGTGRCGWPRNGAHAGAQGNLVAPLWDAVPTCAASKTDGADGPVLHP